MISQSTVS